MAARSKWFEWGELPERELVQVSKEVEAAAVNEILTDRRFHFELVGAEVERDGAAVERFGL